MSRRGSLVWLLVVLLLSACQSGVPAADGDASGRSTDTVSTPTPGSGSVSEASDTPTEPAATTSTSTGSDGHSSPQAEASTDDPDGDIATSEPATSQEAPPITATLAGAVSWPGRTRR